MRAIIEQGFDAVRYVDVAEEAGVAVGTVQHYFASRDALLGAAFLEANRVAVANARADRGLAGGPLDPVAAPDADRRGVHALSTGGGCGSSSGRLPGAATSCAPCSRPPTAPGGSRSSRRSRRASPRACSRRGSRSGEIAGAFVALIDGLGIQRELGLHWLSPQRTRDSVLGALGVGAARRRLTLAVGVLPLKARSAYHIRHVRNRGSLLQVGRRRRPPRRAPVADARPDERPRARLGRRRRLP